MSKHAENTLTPTVVSVTAGTHVPTKEEVAAIVTAVDLTWPHVSAEEDVRETAETVWKFANRWWTGSGIANRVRPRRR